MSSSYVTIRDDTGIRSLSVNERDFLRSCALRKAEPNDSDEEDTKRFHHRALRCDGRRGNDVRNVKMQLGRWDNGAECTVQWGAGTRVTSLCSAELVPPSPDRPNEGIMNFTVDISPMAGSTFKLAPSISTGLSSGHMRGSNHSDQYQRLLSNRILRCIERIILIGGALDTEALVLQSGRWVWKFTVALTVLDAGGNILDACVLATMASLKHYRKPQVDLSEEGEDGTDGSASLPTMIPSIVKEATPLPLHHTPLSISFGLIPADDSANATSSSSSIVAALIDPTDREELVQSGSLTIAMNVHSEVCLLDYGGGCELTPNKLRECWRVAESGIKKLCQMLESALTKADEEAQKERLQKLQMRKSAGSLLQPPLPKVPNIPYFQESSDLEVSVEIDQTETQRAETEAEEAYRRNALDFSSGHAPVAVREDARKGETFSNQAGSLLASMLKSAGQSTPETRRGNEIPSTATKQDRKPSSTQPNKTEEKSITKKPLSSNTDSNEKASKHQTPVKMNLDSDEEEEEPMMLTSEFGSVPKDPPEKKATPKLSVSEDDIEDLSMAIKSKKKKKKSKKK